MCKEYMFPREDSQMRNSVAIGAALVWPFLLLGNLACDVMGMGKSKREYRELVRMLVTRWSGRRFASLRSR